MKPYLFSLFATAVVLALVGLCGYPSSVGDNDYFEPIDTALLLQHPLVLALCDEDGGSIYDSLAIELGVEVAAIKAVSSIESGRSHVAFITAGSPVVNVDVPIFKDALSEAGYDVDSLMRAVPDAFERPSRAIYPDLLMAQRAMYRAASSINDSIAKSCTYWGMYQIRGSNWQLCGAKSIDDFVDKMSLSTNMQHRLFANYIKNSGLDKMLKKHDWVGFARAYNGEGYERSAYHTRLAEAYANYCR